MIKKTLAVLATVGAVGAAAVSAPAPAEAPRHSAPVSRSVWRPAH